MTSAQRRPMRASFAPRERVRAAAARSRGRGAMAVAGVGSLSSVVGGSGGAGGSGAGHDAGDFLARYRLVSNKLRKRFLRKPNVSEAGEQFGQLGKELRAQDCLPYAAWCQLAVARCHQTLFHGPGEALALTEAARLFLRQEREARLRLACAAAYGEPLQAAASCFAFAVRLHLELGQPAAAASLCLELAGALRALQQPGPAAVHFERAAELQLPLLPLEALLALGDAASCKLLTRDYDGALELFTRMQLLARERAAGGPASRAPFWTCWSSVRCPECCCCCCCNPRHPSCCPSTLRPWRSTAGRPSTATARTAAARCPRSSSCCCSPWSWPPTRRTWRQ
uniref:Factor VIII intron 22 protein-like isoform X2 n=1 Tax=Phascolarctos cinereus TaxID=38626 RepID=A0A6P5JD50_PHACI|nr:factor VIII intron 22 protein-like isoform X2 [Phascolarctos cinereus]